MNLQEYAKVLRTRWLTVCLSTLVVVVGAVAVTLVTTPLYQASTRLFVSTTTGGATAADLYQGNRLSQDRVLSYTQLITGESLARRTVDKLDLDMTAGELRANVKATAKANTVLIDVSVKDPSPVQARDIANALSDEFVVMVRELETPEDGSRPYARVVVEQRATILAKPASPNVLRNILTGLGLGLILGIGLALLRDLLDNTVKDRQTVEDITGVGLVGTIPMDKDRKKDAAISYGSDNSAIAESFRKLRTNLQFLSVDNPPRVIVVTSSLPSEGKSTTAINIALSLAESEHEVVLVDGDMRRPSVAKYLGLVGNVGFSSVLSNQVGVRDALQKSRFPGLSVLTSGPIPPNPSELLGSLAAKNTLEDLRKQFDYVIVDSSPLLAVTDAAILAAGADGVLIMARAGQTKREQLSHAVGALTDVGASILGAVLTMVPSRGAGSYSYKYSYSTYGSTDSSPASRHRATEGNAGPS